jgi:hypothetical protein
MFGSNETFDSTNAMSSMFLWLIFGYLAAMLNCDLQRMLYKHPLWIHLFGITAFFFLFTILDTNNKSPIWIVWLKTLFIYFLFVLMTKSKWYFVVPVLVMLLIDQSIKKDLAMREARGDDTTKYKDRQEKITKILNITIIVVIVVGTIHYMFLQKLEYKSKFSMWEFFFGLSRHCKPKSPAYLDELKKIT